MSSKDAHAGVKDDATSLGAGRTLLVELAYEDWRRARRNVIQIERLLASAQTSERECDRRIDALRHQLGQAVVDQLLRQLNKKAMGQ